MKGTTEITKNISGNTEGRNSINDEITAGNPANLERGTIQQNHKEEINDKIKENIKEEINDKINENIKEEINDEAKEEIKKNIYKIEAILPTKKIVFII